jgi:hypothetical protein
MNDMRVHGLKFLPLQDYKFAVKHSEGSGQFVNLNTELVHLLEDTKI